MYDLGTSPWLDFLKRDALQDGTVKEWIENEEVYGITSNPSIFEKGFAESALYKTSIDQLLKDHPDCTIQELYLTEALKDIRTAADLLNPVFEKTKGADGYVSFEISPHFSNDTEGSFKQAIMIHERINKPNVMIKIPATPEGIVAIEKCIEAGICINVTLIFSQRQYLAVAKAYIRGLEKRLDQGLPIDQIHSVASVFLSRIDGAIDSLLPSGSPLKLQTAISNSRIIYELFQQTFGAQFSNLKKAGGNAQRPLWASTSMKDPSGDELAYVESVIGPKTVNTMPLDTMNAFRESGISNLTVIEDIEKAEENISELEKLGIDLESICDELQKNGVQKFIDSYEKLLQTVQEQREKILMGKP